MSKRGRTTIADSPSQLGSFYMTLALTVYVVASIFGSLDMAGQSALANSTILAIQVGGYGALGMAVIIGVMMVANILMALMRGMGGGGQ